MILVLLCHYRVVTSCENGVLNLHCDASVTCVSQLCAELCVLGVIYQQELIYIVFLLKVAAFTAKYFTI